jgi:hypothetical protein
MDASFKFQDSSFKLGNANMARMGRMGPINHVRPIERGRDHRDKRPRLVHPLCDHLKAGANIKPPSSIKLIDERRGLDSGIIGKICLKNNQYSKS